MMSKHNLEYKELGRKARWPPSGIVPREVRERECEPVGQLRLKN